MRGTALPLLIATSLTLTVLAAPQQNPLQTPVQTPQTPPQQPVFRGGTTLVPVDVRVIDRQGKPVTDLTQKDFVILENNVRQQIRHFSTESLVAEAPEPGAKPAIRTATSDVSVPIGQQTARIFLIVMGRGRLQPPAKGVDGMIHFVRERLLPQDLVAVMAWNRSTDFTTDHEQIAQVLERFKKQHEKIESLLAQQFSGLAAIYGGLETPAWVQGSIDSVFSGPEGAKPRTVAESSAPSASRLADDQRRILDALQQNEINANRAPGTFLSDPVESALASNLDMSLDEMASMNAQSMQDLGKIYTGIQYMRYLDGEKHLLFVTEYGIFLPRAEDDKNLASIASDARVALDIVHTGGTAPRSFDWRGMTSRTAAEETGGTYSSTSYAKDFVNRLDDATRFQYVLGYAPSNTRLDNKFRQIRVSVIGRPGVQVLYRHGYFASQQLPPLDRRRVFSYSRVTTAAGYATEVHDIGLTATAENITGADGSRTVKVQVKIKPDRLSFKDVDGKKAGSIDVAIFCSDDRQRLIGQAWNVAELQMTPAAFERFMAAGVTYTESVKVNTVARYVKIVVYDYGADVVGSAVVKIDK
jgi:VWFA-related protein